MRFTMRRLVDVVCALFIIGVVASILYFNSQTARQRHTIAGVADDLRRFRDAIELHGAAGSGTNARGWPATIDPAWFGSNPPRNELVTPDRPWVELATEDEAGLSDPDVRMTLNTRLASFWYNPYQGIIRARVPVEISDERALANYNAINGTHLDSIYGAGARPGSAPRPEPPKKSTASAEHDADPPVPSKR